MILQGKSIILRPVLLSDAALLHKWENDRSVWNVSGTRKPFTKKEIENFIRKQNDIYLDKQLRLMICRSAVPLSPARTKTILIKEGKANAPVGCIDLFSFHEGRLKAGIGILIDEKHRKNGYATEALSLLIRYCFLTLRLREIYCSISEANEPSLKLFQSHKFRITAKKKNVYSLKLAQNPSNIFIPTSRQRAS